LYYPCGHVCIPGTKLISAKRVAFPALLARYEPR
jgi:hypothetical protein